MLNPQPTLEALSAYYEEGYYPNRQWIESVDLGTVMRMSTGKLQAYHETLARISGYTRGRRLLDVGCAFGQFLHVSAGAGYAAEGVELDRLVAARARDFGFQVTGGDFLQTDLGEEAWDVLTFWYVLEHVTDPLAYLKESHRLLKPGGVLFVRVPNMLFGLPFLYTGLAGRSLAPSILAHIPAHLFFFTPGVLRRLLQAAGFRVLRADHGVPIFSAGKSWRSRIGDDARRIEVSAADLVAALSANRLLCGPYLSVYGQKGLGVA